MELLYKLIGTKLKRVFLGYHAWVISSNTDYLTAIGLTPSTKEAMQNGGLDCELREYVIFEGTKSEFRREGGVLKEEGTARPERKRPERKSDREWKRDARDKGMGGKEAASSRRKSNALEDKYRPKKEDMHAARSAAANSRRKPPHRARPRNSSRATVTPMRSSRSANRPSAPRFPRPKVPSCAHAAGGNAPTPTATTATPPKTTDFNKAPNQYIP